MGSEEKCGPTKDTKEPEGLSSSKATHQHTKLSYSMAGSGLTKQKWSMFFPYGRWEPRRPTKQSKNQNHEDRCHPRNSCSIVFCVCSLYVRHFFCINSCRAGTKTLSGWFYQNHPDLGCQSEGHSLGKLKTPDLGWSLSKGHWELLILVGLALHPLTHSVSPTNRIP